MTHTLTPLRVLLIALALLVMAFLIGEALGWPFLRQPVAERLSAQLQREVRLEGDFRLQLLGGIRLRAGHLAIASSDWEAERSGKRDFISASKLRVRLGYGSVLRQLRGSDRPLLIQRLEAEHLQARLVRNADGQANWRFRRPAQPQDSPPPKFRHFIVQRGTVTLEDIPLDLILQARVRTEEGSASGQRGLEVVAEGRYQEQSFTARARSSGILPIVSPPDAAPPVPLTLDGHLTYPEQADTRLHLQGRAGDLLNFQGLTGRYELSGPSLAAVGDLLGVTLPTTAAFTMNGEARRQGPLWDVRVSDFRVGRTHLGGQFRYDTSAKQPRLSGDLQGTQLVLVDLAPALGASPAQGGRETAAAPAGRKLLPQREFDIPALGRMDADVAIAIDRVDLGSEKLKPLAPFRARLTLARGVLTLDDMLARTADGTLKGALKLDGQPEQPLWAADLDWSGVKLQEWITVGNRFADEDQAGPGGKAPTFISGELAGQAELAGRGRSTAAMLGSLDGVLQLWVRNGEISHLLLEAMGLDIAEGLGVLIKGDENLPLRCAAVSFKAENGTLRTDAGLIDTPDTLLLLRGHILLDEERLALTVEAKPHDRSLLSVRAPLHIRGRFSDPEIRPDASRVGAKAVAATVLGAVLAPLAALLPLVDTGGDTERGCAQLLARLRQNPETPAAMEKAVTPGKHDRKGSDKNGR